MNYENKLISYETHLTQSIHLLVILYEFLLKSIFHRIYIVK